MWVIRLCTVAIMCQHICNFYLLSLGVDGGFLRFSLKGSHLFGIYDLLVYVFGGAVIFLVALNVLVRPEKNIAQITVCGIVLLFIYSVYISISFSFEFLSYGFCILLPYFIPTLVQAECKRVVNRDIHDKNTDE